LHRTRHWEHEFDVLGDFAMLARRAGSAIQDRPMADAKRFQYYASFISYSHAAQDARWAEWRQRKLESYRIPSTYDERGNAIEMAFFGVDGKPCRLKDGVARLTITYDERDNVGGAARFDEDGRLIPVVGIGVQLARSACRSGCYDFRPSGCATGYSTLCAL